MRGIAKDGLMYHVISFPKNKISLSNSLAVVHVLSSLAFLDILIFGSGIIRTASLHKTKQPVPSSTLLTAVLY